MEGCFRRSCTRTLGALRKNSRHLVRLVESILGDPLVDWDYDSANKAAQKASLPGPSRGPLELGKARSQRAFTRDTSPRSLNEKQQKHTPLL